MCEINTRDWKIETVFATVQPKVYIKLKTVINPVISTVEYIKKIYIYIVYIECIVTYSKAVSLNGQVYSAIFSSPFDAGNIYARSETRNSLRNGSSQCIILPKIEK